MNTLGGGHVSTFVDFAMRKFAPARRQRLKVDLAQRVVNGQPQPGPRRPVAGRPTRPPGGTKPPSRRNRVAARAAPALIAPVPHRLGRLAAP